MRIVVEGRGEGKWYLKDSKDLSHQFRKTV
jgi:hypothetical protein